MARTVLGHSVHRVEDAETLRGLSQYAADVALEVGAAYAYFVRSQQPHALIRSVDTTAARAQPGVIGVFTDADLGLATSAGRGGDDAYAWPRLARDRVRFVGEAIAVVVADSYELAVDAAEHVEVDYEPLPAIVDVDTAIAPGATKLFPDSKGNAVGRKAPPAPNDGWPDADVVIRTRFVHPRLAPAPMEPSGCVAAPSRDGHGLEVWASTQSVFGVRGEIANSLDLDPALVTVRAPAVGGGFGAKGGTYNEQIIVAALARTLQRGVAWLETRTENLLNMTHGRDQTQDVEIGARRDGTIVGLRVRALANVGAYPGRGAFIPWVTQIMASGVYRLPAIEYTGLPVVTNTTPTGPYRGAGRPEAAAMTERMIEVVADTLGLDANDVRRRNFIPPDAFPYRTATGATYDCGEYERALDAAIEHSGYETWRAEQRARRDRGDTRQLGVGIACYVEVSGRGGEYGSVRVEPDGRATVISGSVPNGQGHETTWAQIASAALGVSFEHVRVVHSDTQHVPHGTGTFGSRSTQLAGSAIQRASETVLEQARRVVASMLEAAVDDVVVFDDGRLGVAGVPASATSWEEIARAAYAHPTTATDAPPLFGELDFDSDGSFPFGCHVAIVELDTETGLIDLLEHVAVDDCGTVINPMLVEGQVHGGIAQGVTQALFERFVYDADGNPLTTNFLDYAVPSAAELPSFAVHHTVTPTPTPTNPLGAKGIGESGTTGASAAVWNAVIDALRPYGVQHLDMPFTPERVWQAINGEGHTPVAVATSP